MLETSLGKIDELMHIGRTVRRMALQSSLGGTAASLLGTNWGADRNKNLVVAFEILSVSHRSLLSPNFARF
jgi:hypothetical protein